MLAYFIKVNVAIILLYAFYRLFFYKDTFFGWRRIALLCFFAISAVHPLLNIQTWIVQQEPMVAMADLYATVILPELTFTPQANSLRSWDNIILDSIYLIYWGVVTLLTIRLLIQLAGIIRLALHCQTIKVNDTVLHLLTSPSGPFSFFRWIFVHPASHTKEELNEIVTHEQSHARQWHSIDVLISELVCLFCWFNPFAWLIKREIRANLEYMADAHVLENGYDSKTYQYHLLELSQHKAAATIYNSFNVLPLKKRIKMMNKKRTKEIGRTKYLMFLPLAALLMLISNIEAVARTTKEVAKDVIEAVEVKMTSPDSNSQPPQDKKKADTKQDGDKVYEVVEVMPQFPNGGVSGLLSYLSKNIKYPASAIVKKIQGRVVVQFIVNADGSISGAKVLQGGIDPDLNKEALRVVSNMPNWKPGTQKGKAVRVKYTLPVMFSLSKDKTSDKGKVVDLKYKPTPSDENVVFEVVEYMPEFPGGMGKLMEYIAKNIQYPAEAKAAGIQGRVTIQTIIDKEGNPTNTKILRGVNPALNAEAIRVMSTMPKWKPGTQRGVPVNVKYTLPIVFKL